MGHSAPRISTIDGIVDEISALLGPMLIEARDHADEFSFTVRREDLAEAMVALRDLAHYQQLMEIAGVDYPDRAERFEICYHLLSVTRNHRVRVKVSTDEDMPVPTVTHLWPVAGWLEREVFDMYGVVFEGNTDLRRILTDYGFRGHPLRKDFPLTGYVEMWYSEEDQRVVYKPVHLQQDFRSFDFMSPWEGAEYVLPGDEKAPQAPGAPTPAAAPPPPPAPPKGAPAQGDNKVTETPAQTGAGEPANAEAAKPTEEKPVPQGAATSAGEVKVQPTQEPDAAPVVEGKGAAKPGTEEGKK